MNVKIHKVNNKAKVEANGNEVILHATTERFDIMNNGAIEYDTGVTVDVPKDHVAMIVPLDTMFYKTTLLSQEGIQFVYGENVKDTIKLRTKTFATSGATKFRIGDAIARLVILPVASVTFQLVETNGEETKGTL